MNDYRDIVDNLRRCTTEWLNPGPRAIDEAADAIEALTAERDALTRRIVEMEQVKEET